MTEPEQSPFSWSTMKRIRMSGTMRGNKNASSESFSDELAREFADDPETAEWIKKNKANLDSANSDGSIPKSSQEIIKKNELQLFNGNLVVDENL